MEYFLCRALEVCRLSEEDLVKMQVKERNIKHGLNPFEVQEIFKLPTIKEHYGIPPENDNAQANHNQRLRSEFRKANLYPKYDDLSYGDLETLHAFDWAVRKAVADRKIDFEFRLGKSGRRAVDKFDE